jgi:general secretion pathway protein C
MKLARMRSNGLLAHLGFEPNDQIVSINGYRMTGPESALGVYARLRTTNNLQVQVRRNDRPVTLEVAIQ